MGSIFSRVKTWVTGETLTAAQLNAEFDNILDNLDPTGIDDESASDAAAQATSDPYASSSLVKAASLETEIQQLRYLIAQITGETYWYIDPDTTLAALNTFLASLNLTDHGVLVGSGSSPVTPLAAMTNGQLIVGATGADPAPKTLSGDATLAADGALTIAADAVDDTKIGDAKIKKEHINADIVGTGLAGGAGTALSVDGIKDAGGTELKVKIVDIGDWNMDTSGNVTVAHGLTWTDIRSIQVLIRNDSDNARLPLNVSESDGTSAGFFYLGSATHVYLYRVATSSFDNNAYDSTSYNRGWITIWYVV